MTTRLISTTTEPLTITEAMRMARIDGAENTEAGAIVAILLPAAREACEQECGRGIALATWELTLDEFPDEIKLLWPPILTVEYVKYIDANGVLQTLATSQYTLDAKSEPGWVLRAVDVEWPETQDVANALTVRYTAGYGTFCPAVIKQWIAGQVANGYNGWDPVVKGATVTKNPYFDGLLDRYRLPGF